MQALLGLSNLFNARKSLLGKGLMESILEVTIDMVDNKIAMVTSRMDSISPLPKSDLRALNRLDRPREICCN